LLFCPTSSLLGQQIRYALADGGIAFTDETEAIFPPPPETKKKWAEIGGNSTTNVPMLTMDGKTYTQSSAVMIFVGRKAGTYPSDPELAYQVDNLLAAADDFRKAAYGLIFGDSSAEAVASFKDNAIAAHMGNFERILGDNDWFAGDFSIADITVFDCCNNYSFNIVPSSKGSHPKLSAFMDRCAARPNMKAYMASEQFASLRPFPCLEK
jgi:glutathione S-transferase